MPARRLRILLPRAGRRNADSVQRTPAVSGRTSGGGRQPALSAGHSFGALFASIPVGAPEENFLAAAVDADPSAGSRNRRRGGVLLQSGHARRLSGWGPAARRAQGI